MALGQTDYGLMGLVGGLVAFVTFFNGLLAESVGRFYAVSVGAAKKEGNAEKGLEDCRKWFNTAVLMHTAIPVVLIVIGYPIGLWAVNSFLTIPPDRVAACRWVWSFSCLATLVSMMNVPFRAMYGAKQEIAELTLYGFATTTLNALFLYYMVNHPGAWLVKFSAWSLLLSVLPQSIMAIRAFMKYPECRFVARYIWDPSRCREVLAFASARFVSGLAGMLCGQGQSILVNKYLGPVANASVAIGNTVAGHSMTLAGALSGAFWPAVANKAGEGDADGVRVMCLMVCKLSTVMVLVFALPLALEAHEVLRLWLVNPPRFSAEICIAVLAGAVLERMTEGCWMAILGFGEGVMRYSRSICLGGFMLVAVAWGCFSLGLGMWSVIAGIVAYACSMVGVRLYMMRVLLRYSIAQWTRLVLMPILLTILTAIIAGLPSRLLIEPSFARVVLTVLCCEVVIIPGVWLLVLEAGERQFMRVKVLSRIPILGDQFKRKG